MIHIKKDSRFIDSLVVTRTEEHWSGQRWDDGDVETVRYFKESGVFLTGAEIRKLDLWLTYFLQFMNAYDKEKRYTESAREVREFLLQLKPSVNRE